MKKFIAKYVVIVALLTCAFACISGVSAEEIVTFGASTSGKISLKCGEKVLGVIRQQALIVILLSQKLLGYLVRLHWQMLQLD